jgi:hypothetical protein
MSKREDNLFAIHDYFFKNESASMLIIYGKDYKEKLDTMMEVAYRNRDKIRPMKVLGNSYPPNKFSFIRIDDTLKMVYFAEMRSYYLDDMARDWNAVILDFDQPRLTGI